ncbi:MAG: HNH endonuclease signature motif containing protein [Candidatus Paceibacterota bacterium]
MFSKFKKTYTDSNGYKRYKKSRKLVHRVVMKKVLGGEIYEGRVVHHRDGNKKNNKPSNLQVCSRSEHYRIHQKKKSRKSHDYDYW